MRRPPRAGVGPFGMACTACVAFLPALLACACGGAGTGARPTSVSVRVAGSPPGASVSVDDQLVGTLDVLAARGLALPPGHHRVSVEAPGYFPWDKEIEAGTSSPQPLRLDVRLEPIPD